MGANNIHYRLKLYELALADYEASLRKRYLYKIKHHTSLGFCHYFFHAHHLWVFESLETQLPELYGTHPMGKLVYWFGDGKIPPRIECLKRAIELTKSKIWEQS